MDEIIIAITIPVVIIVCVIIMEFNAVSNGVVKIIKAWKGEN